MGRPGLSRPARSHPQRSASGAGFHQSPLQAPWRGGRGQKVEEPHQARVRAKVEHPFLVIKRVFGFARVRYRGLEKNAHRLFVTCALANLFMLRYRLA
jgi:IS5 family transposase